MKILCVIPVFNEYHKLFYLIDQLKENEYKNFNLKYIFINNGSTDNSLSIINKSKFSYLNLKKNKGVGYALMLGYLYAKKYKYDFVIHLAGNGKMKPSEIKYFIDKSKKYDFISGSRFLDGSSRKNNPRYRIFLIKIFSFLINFLFKINITDSTCGFRMFKTQIFENFEKNFFRKRSFYIWV